MRNSLSLFRAARLNLLMVINYFSCFSIDEEDMRMAMNDVNISKYP